MRLGDPRRDGADPRRADELDADARLRIDLLEVVDELREILDRIDVVMWRRRDKHHARRRLAQAGDDFGDPEQIGGATRGEMEGQSGYMSVCPGGLTTKKSEAYIS